MSKYILFGAGKMGQAVAYDILKSNPFNELIIIDNSKRALKRILKYNSKNSSRIHTANYPLEDGLVNKFMKQSDCAISCLPYDFNYKLSEMAVNCRTHFCDLGGNNNIVEQQYSLERRALERDVAIIPDCGIAPGYVSILAADCIANMDEVENLKLRVGGLPEFPKGLFKYAISFSVHGLINEYKLPCEVIKNGISKTVPALEELENICFGGFPQLEAFNTSGGLSTLTRTLANKVKNLDYKTIRYKGHCKKIKLMFDCGMFKEDFREENENAFAKILGTAKEDVILVRILAQGLKDGKKVEKGYQIIDKYNPKTKLSAMQRNTGFSISIIAQMLAEDKINARGVLPQEYHVPRQKFIKELKKRGIMVRKIGI